MNSRFEEITSFLKYTYETKKQNPDYSVFDLSTYILKKYDVDKLKNNQDYNQYFDYWINYYKDNKNIVVGKDFSKPGHLIIRNNSNNEFFDTFINLYLNVSEKGLFNFVSNLINYFHHHLDINYYADVCADAQSDQIVIKLVNITDANQIIDYIYKEPSLYNVLRRTNPFVIHHGLIGISCSKYLNYSDVISYFIEEYLDQKYDEYKIDGNDFISFLNDYLEQLTSLSCFDKFERLINSDLFLRDYDTLSDIDLSKTKDDVFDEYLFFIKQFIKLYDGNDFLEFIKIFEQLKTNFESVENKKIFNMKNHLKSVKDDLDSYIKYVFQVKGEKPDEIENRLITFMQNKDSSDDNLVLRAQRSITRDLNYRSKFKNISPSDISIITNNEILEYIEQLLKRENIIGYDNV